MGGREGEWLASQEEGKTRNKSHLTFSLRRVSDGGGAVRTTTVEEEGVDVPVDEDIVFLYRVI